MRDARSVTTRDACSPSIQALPAVPPGSLCAPVLCTRRWVWKVVTRRAYHPRRARSAPWCRRQPRPSCLRFAQPSVQAAHFIQGAPSVQGAPSSVQDAVSSIQGTVSSIQGAVSIPGAPPLQIVPLRSPPLPCGPALSPGRPAAPCAERRAHPTGGGHPGPHSCRARVRPV